MKHIILTAFGASESAKKTYLFLESQFAARFSDTQLHWSVSSPSINRPADDRQPDGESDLATMLKNFTAEDRTRVIVQSLHLTPGLEFHRIARHVRTLWPDITIGMPLLGTPEDFNRVTDCLLPLFPDATDAGVLLIGHGTTHPSWTIYPIMEKVLRARTRSPVFVAALQHFPDSRSVIDHMVASAAKRWLVIPLLLSTGKHFQRDIAGPQPHSWSSRLRQRGLSPIFHDEGLGTLAGIADIFGDHIQEAFARAAGKTV